MREIRRDEDYFAIVYEFVPERAGGALATAAELQPQLEFFWLVGFCFAPVMRTEEWHRFGLFMDMCDLVNLLAVGWHDTVYRRFVVRDDTLDHGAGTDGFDNDGSDGDGSSTIAKLPSPRGRRHDLVYE